MILGGVPFDWSPDRFTLPRSKVPTLVGQGKDLLDVLRYPALVAGMPIVLEWDWMSEEQYEAMRYIFSQGGTIEWMPQAMSAGGVLYPDTNNPMRLYHSSVSLYYGCASTSSQSIPVGAGVTMYIAAIDDWTDDTARVTASGDHWIELDVFKDYLGNPVQPQLGDYIAAFDPDTWDDLGTTYITPWGGSYQAASIYPDPAHPTRIYYTTFPADDPYINPYQVGETITTDYYNDYPQYRVSGYQATVTAVGPGWMEVDIFSPSSYSSGLWCFNEYIGPHLAPPWGGPGLVGLHSGVALPEAGEEGGGGGDTFNVRAVHFTGELFRTAHYEQPYRRNVRMLLNIREQVA